MKKNDIVPVQQAGFRKGRCTTDHLVKLTSHIKKQFSRRKSLLATFFDVKKAYDRVWHARLLYKLRNIGISGNMYDYIRNFLESRNICTRIGKTYSSSRKIDMGIPQGSVIAPLLFTILIHDLPKALSKTTNVVQYADDIAIWINTSLRKSCNKRSVNFVQTLYQKELDKLTAYMKENGLELSGEKTCLMLFNNGENPKTLPILCLDNNVLQYKQTVKFLGVFLTSKLNWKKHIGNLIDKGRKRLNLLKIICCQPWGQDYTTLLHLYTSLVRSKLTYGQEVYFSAPNYLLNKLQSLDSKALKLALGVPVHTNTLKCYKEANILSLNEQRILDVSKYVVRSLCVKNSVTSEILMDSNNEYPKRSKNITYIKPVRNFTNDLISECNIDIDAISEVPIIPQMPPWEHLNAIIDDEYTTLNKADNVNILVSEVREHLDKTYPNHLKVFTDGSVMETSDCGAGFVIPYLNVHKSFYLGRDFTIYTAELYAIMKALIYILNDTSVTFYSVLFCVD